MAALHERFPEPLPGSQELVDLRRLTGRELDPLLLEETLEWRQRLAWDFSKSAELIRQFVDSRSLAGFALLHRAEVTGFGYSVVEEHKGLVGDVYVRPARREVDVEAALFIAILDGLIATPHVHRIESQLMLADSAVARIVERERSVKLFERSLMTLELEASAFPGCTLKGRFHLQPWADHLQDAAATVISSAYSGHIDSQINDQYRSPGGARRFLYNIVQYPGCGTFFRGGSFLAFDAATGCPAGLALVSFVASETGHITQLCVTPKAKGSGLGYELLRQAIAALRRNGAERVSLTVTTANREAIRLYERCGFQETRRFFAYVWENAAARFRST